MSDLRIFYAMVQHTREMCAGDNIQCYDKVRKALREAIEFGNKREIDVVYLRLCTEALTKLESAKEFKDRLEPDHILCDILNSINKSGA